MHKYRVIYYRTDCVAAFCSYYTNPHAQNEEAVLDEFLNECKDELDKIHIVSIIYDGK